MASIDGPITVNRSLYHKYASSQTYFYTNKINQIIKQKRKSVNIYYEDIEYLIDLEENLKRWYQAKEYNNKLFTFKQYYFYHQDSPRIFMQGIQEAYAKWQDKKRDLVYKKLKLIYNQTYQSSVDSQFDQQKSQNKVAVTHFLLQISDYNPYSKKYYLRVQAKKQKQRKKQIQQKANNSKRDMKFLKDQLSIMLQDISFLSQISTLSNQSARHIPKQKIRYIAQKSTQKSKDSSTRLSNSNSLVKFNFRKTKNSNQKLQAIKQIRRQSLRQKLNLKQTQVDPIKMNIKYNSNNIMQNANSKRTSIFSVSNFGGLNKQSQMKISSNKKETLKINTEQKKISNDLQNKKYSTQKKKQSVLPKNIIIKSKSSSKFQYNQKNKNVKKEQQSNKLKYDQFSDKKMGFQSGQYRLRSIKSQFISVPDKKKLLFTLKPSVQLQKGKRILQLKQW